MGKRLGLCSILCLILMTGLVLICTPWMMEMLLEETQQAFQPVHFTVQELLNNQQEATYVETEPDVAVPDIVQIFRNIRKVKRSDVIGYLYIEQAGISLPVLNGTTKANLLVGATTTGREQIMGEGNYVLAGHHMNAPDRLFSALLKVREGAAVCLTDGVHVYVYEVTETKLVHQTQTEVLENRAEPMITLITCDSAGLNTEYRWVVTGVLQRTAAAAEPGHAGEIWSLEELPDSAIKKKADGVTLWQLLTGIFLAALIMTAAAYRWIYSN